MPLFYSEKGFLKAARNGDLETLKKYLATDKAAAMLVAKDDKGMTALLSAAQSAELDCFKLLLEAGADITARSNNNKTVLHLAAGHMQSDFISLCLQQGLMPEKKLGEGSDSALSIAAGRNRPENVRLLLEAGADVNDRSALVYTFRNSHYETAELLVKHGVDVNLRDNYYQYTPLHFVASNGNIHLLKLLLEQDGIDLDAKAKDGGTPLHAAAYNGHVMLIEVLLKAGANTEIENNEGMTAADVALQRGQPQSAKLIQQKMREKSESAEKETLYAVPAAAKASDDRETWLRIGQDKIAHIGSYPAIERKLTEIFNFTTRERLTISENLRTGVENTLPPQSFDSLPDAALDAAYDAFTAQGGTAERTAAVKKQFTAKPGG